MSEDDKLIAATNHIVNQFKETISEMKPELCRRFHIDGHQLNTAIARAGMGITAMAALSNCEGSIVVDAGELAGRIEELVERTIDERHQQS